MSVLVARPHPRQRLPTRIRRRGAALRRGGRRALGPTRAHRHRPLGDPRPSRRRRPHGPLRRHALVLPPARSRSPPAGRRGGGARRGAGGPPGGPWHPRVRRPRAARRGPRLDTCLGRGVARRVAGPPPGHGRRGLARDARRLRHRRRHARAPRGSGERGARSGVGPGQRLLGVRRGAREGRCGPRHLPAPRPPQGRAAPARREDPVAPGAAGPRGLPGHARAGLAAGGGRRPLGVLRVGEALAPGDRGAGSGSPAFPPLGRGRAPGATGDGAHGRASPRLRPPARGGLSDSTHDGPRGGARGGRRHPRPPRSRGPGGRRFRLRALPERVPGRAAAGARHRLAEAHGVPPRRVRRHRPRPPCLLPAVPRRPALRPREGGRVPRPRRPGAGPGGGVRPLRRAPSAGGPGPGHPRSRGERSPRVHRPPGAATSRSGRTCAWWTSTRRAGGSR